MDWVSATLGVPAAVIALAAIIGRIVVILYALHGTDPQDRPQILRALGRMYKDSQWELPRRHERGGDPPLPPS